MQLTTLKVTYFPPYSILNKGEFASHYEMNFINIEIIIGENIDFRKLLSCGNVSAPTHTEVIEFTHQTQTIL